MRRAPPSSRKAVEVADERHVGIGGVDRCPVLPPRASSCHSLAAATEPGTARRNRPSGCALAQRRPSRGAQRSRADGTYGRRRNRVGPDPGGEKFDRACDRTGPGSGLSTADRRGGSDDLRPDYLPIDASGAERLQRRFVQADHRAQRSRDQVQLVLNDQVGRQQRRTPEAAPALRLGTDHRTRRRRRARPCRRMRRPDPTHGIAANLSTVAMRNAASDDKSARPRPAPADGALLENSHSRFDADQQQIGRRFVVRHRDETHPCRTSSPHHGHVSSGIGGRLRSVALDSAIIWARAVLGSLSPSAPIRFGVAPRPTQRPISNGHSPSFVGIGRGGSSSRAQTTAAARPS